MTCVTDRIRLLRVCVVPIALCIAVACGDAALERRSAPGPNASGSAKRMADGKQWTTGNLNVTTVPSYCFDDAEQNCHQYGRLYTWSAADQGRAWFYNFGRGGLSVNRHGGGEQKMALSVWCVRD